MQALAMAFCLNDKHAFWGQACLTFSANELVMKFGRYHSFLADSGCSE
jgi:hypothetical protein